MPTEVITTRCLFCDSVVMFEDGMWLSPSGMGRLWCTRNAMAPGAKQHQPDLSFRYGSMVRLVGPMTYHGELAHEISEGTRARADVPVGEVGRVVTRNTTNHRVDTIGVDFAGADGSWVVDTDCCEMWSPRGASERELLGWLDA